MSETIEATATAPAHALARSRVFMGVEQRELLLFGVATLAAWAHTIDEIRIGELIAVLNRRQPASSDPKFEASQDIPDFPYARYAEVVGLKGVRVHSPDEIGDAWDEVLAADRPAVLEAVTDPEVPPLPPHITFEQARHFMLAVARGDPGRRAFIEQSLKAKLKEFLPGRG
jgi:hypothetical protein